MKKELWKIIISIFLVIILIIPLISTISFSQTTIRDEIIKDYFKINDDSQYIIQGEPDVTITLDLNSYNYKTKNIETFKSSPFYMVYDEFGRNIFYNDFVHQSLFKTPMIVFL